MGTTAVFFLTILAASLLMYISLPAVKIKDGLFVIFLSAFCALIIPSISILSPAFAFVLLGAVSLAMIFPFLFHILGKYTSFFETVLIGPKED